MSSPDPLHSHLTSETFSSHLSSLKQIHVTLTEAHSESQEKIKTLESALAKSEREIASLKNEVRRLEEKRRTAMETLGKEEMTVTSANKLHETFANMELQTSPSIYRPEDNAEIDGYRTSSFEQTLPYPAQALPRGSSESAEAGTRATSPDGFAAEESAYWHNKVSVPHRSSRSSKKSQNTVDGSVFFRAARARLNYDEFTMLMDNTKAYNAKDQSKRDTLANLDQLFGKKNRDLYVQFERMLSGHA